MTQRAKRGKVNERLVAGVWQWQLFDPEMLATGSGQKVLVLDPGWENRDAGPDFRQAVLALGGDGPQRGDVEVHVRAADWQAHAHHLDPNYNDVILHVVWQGEPGRPAESPLQSGSSAAVLALGGHLEGRLEELRRMVACRRAAPRPCAGALDRRGREGVQAALDVAAAERFRRKAGELRERLWQVGPGQALYEGLMAGLGYSKNKESCHELAVRLPLARLEGLGGEGSAYAGLLDMQALLLGTAGLLPTQRGLELEEGWPQALEQRWRVLGGRQEMFPGCWHFFRVRPENFPTRRLVAAGHLLAGAGGLLERAAGLMERADCAEPWRELERGLLVSAGGYWAEHFDFGRPAPVGRSRPTLLGLGRAGEVAVNVLLPFLHAWSGPEGGARAEQLARRYHILEGNWVTRRLERQLGAGIADSAWRQQGLLELHRAFCSLGGCGACPLGGSGLMP